MPQLANIYFLYYSWEECR